MEQQLQTNLLLLQHRQSYGCIDWCVWWSCQEQNARVETSDIFPVILDMEDMENQRDDCQASPALGETSVKMSAAE